MTVLVLGVFSAFRVMLGIEYGVFSAILTIATIVVAVVAVIHVESAASSNYGELKNSPYTGERLIEDLWESDEEVVTQGSDGQSWALTEDGMSQL